MRFLNWLKKQRKKVLRRGPTVVEFDDLSITCRRPSGLVETVQWSDLEAVIIQTTDQGPLLDDVFWILVGKKSGCVVPSEARGSNELLTRLQDLPGFDNRLFIEAMKCTENEKFVCWRRDAASENSFR